MSRPWFQQASPLSRHALLIYCALIAYSSLYPFRDWKNAGVGLLAWVTAPLPRYLTSFDIVVNILGYMPFGALVVLALHPRVRRAAAVALAALLGAGLSFGMETLQTWLPGRVPSNIDLLANAGGALLGALLIAPWSGALLDRGYLRQWRFSWFDRDASFLLAVIMLWPFAQIFPQAWLFGTGDITRHLLSLVPGWLPETLQQFLPDFLLFRESLATGGIDMRRFAAWEVLVTGLAWLGAGLLLSVPMNRAAPRLRLLLGMLAFALVVKWGCHALQFPGPRSTEWLTSGALLGLAGAGIVLFVVVWLPRALRVVLALLSLVAALLLVNLLPENPYHLATLSDWRQGRFVHFNGLAQWIGWIWPYLALVALVGYGERLELRYHAGRRQSR